MTRTEHIARNLKNTQVMEARGETDTIRLWENFREQAMMWRALALFQIPTSLLLVIFSTVLFVTHKTYLSVPANPLPGVYRADEINDKIFVEYANDFINLVATYNPATARKQFVAAKEMLREPMLSRFESEMMEIELKAIETTNRTQIYFPDPTRTEPQRPNNKDVVVSFVGDRLKLVSGKELPVVKSKFTVTMTTIPRNSPLNPYGIVITNVIFENVER